MNKNIYIRDTKGVAVSVFVVVAALCSGAAETRCCGQHWGGGPEAPRGSGGLTSIDTVQSGDSWCPERRQVSPWGLFF